MGQWVVTVAGIAILAVLCDIVMPDGQTRKYIKTVIGVVVTLVMIQPIVSFAFGAGANFGDSTANVTEVKVQQSYLDMVDDKQIQAKARAAVDALSARNVQTTVTQIDKRAKKLTLRSTSTQSQQNKSTIDNVMSTYFPDYTITIEWKRS